MNAKLNDPRYVPGVSDVDDDLTDAEWLDAYGPACPCQWDGCPLREGEL